MRSFSSLTAAATLVAGLGLASAAGAATVEWAGTLIVAPGTLDQFQHFGTGVATVNGSAGGGHINTIRWRRGLSFYRGNNLPETIPLTDPEHPTLMTLKATGLRLGTQTFNGISGGPPLGSKNTGIPPGEMNMCILFPSCAAYLPFPFGTPSENVGIGVGGSLTVNTFSKGNGLKVSIWGAPWTIGLASIKNVTTETLNGAITTYTKTLQGFVHGPASGSSSTAAISGVLQVITPVLIRTNLGAPDTWQAAWFEVRLHVIPEPGLLLLLGSGVAGLMLLGRSRMRG
jgi:hypothetical protein